MRSYSVAEARNRFAEILHDLKKTPRVEVTRRGVPVAVLISIEEYERLCAHRPDPWEAYQAFRKELEQAGIEIDPDEVFGDVRDKSPGREVNL